MFIHSKHSIYVITKIGTLSLFQPQPPIALILPGLHSSFKIMLIFAVFIFWCVPIFSPNPNGTSDNANAVYPFQAFHLCNYQGWDTVPFLAPTPNCTDFTRVTLVIQNYADFAVFIFWCVPIFSPSPNGTSDNANDVYPFQSFHLCNYQDRDTVSLF